MFYGLIAAPILIFPGILLCFLGWGIVLGIPMILLGILMPIAAPIFGLGEHKGKMNIKLAPAWRQAVCK
jgi:hypothetical protein